MASPDSLHTQLRFIVYSNQRATIYATLCLVNLIDFHLCRPACRIVIEIRTLTTAANFPSCFVVITYQN